MTAAMRKFLEAQSPKQIEKLERDSVKALQLAWPSRNNDLRAKSVCQQNIVMLRNLRSL